MGIILKVFFNPTEVFEYLKNDNNYKKFILPSIFLVFYIVLSLTVARFLGKNNIAETISIILTSKIVVLFILFIMLLLMQSIIWYFFANIMEKDGQKTSPVLLYVLVSLSYLPLVFMPAVSIATLFLQNSSTAIFGFIKLLISLWVFYLQIIVLKKLFRIGILKTIFIYITPFLLLVALSISLLSNIFVSISLMSISSSFFL